MCHKCNCTTCNATHLDGNVEIGKVLHDPVDQPLDVVLAQVLGDGLDLQKVSVLVGHEAVLGEVVRKDLGNANSELLLLLGEVGAADDADGDLLGEGLHEVHHLGRHLAAGDGEGTIDVEEGADARVLGLGRRAHGFVGWIMRVISSFQRREVIEFYGTVTGNQ